MSSAEIGFVLGVVIAGLFAWLVRDSIARDIERDLKAELDTTREALDSALERYALLEEELEYIQGLERERAERRRRIEAAWLHLDPPPEDPPRRVWRVDGTWEGVN